MGDKKPTEGSVSVSVGDIEAMAPVKKAEEGSSGTSIEAAAVPGTGEEAAAARGTGEEAAGAGKAEAAVNFPKVNRSPVEELILKRVRHFAKKIKEADKIQGKRSLNEDQRRKLESRSGFEMVREELEHIFSMLPDCLEQEKLQLLGTCKEKGEPSSPPAIPKKIQNVKENEGETKDPLVDESPAVNPTSQPTATDPFPPAETQKWGEIKHGKKKMQYTHVTMAQPDKEVVQAFQKFLSKPTYHTQLAAIATGPGSVLHVPYADICQYSRNLAMEICHGYKRLIKKLTVAARDYMKTHLQPVDNLTLRFLELPSSHQTLRQFIQVNTPLLESIEVFGEKKRIKRPTSEACIMLQEIIWYIIRNHRKGKSWAGNFDVDDIEVFNKRTFVIKKPPQGFKVQSELIKATEQDFMTVASKILSQLSSQDPDSVTLLFTQYNNMLRNMDRYAPFWSSDKLVENLRDLVGHHPFLKPPLATATLLSGLHTASRFYDEGDTTARFKALMKVTVFSGWPKEIRSSKNQLLIDQYNFKEKMNLKVDQVYKSGKGKVLASEEYDWLHHRAYNNDMDSFVEYVRHLFHHGKDHTKEKRIFRMNHEGLVFDPNPNPRKQYMGSNVETEAAVSIHSGSFIFEVLYTLAAEDAFDGMLTLCWNAYKNCCFSTSLSLGNSSMDEWQLIKSHDDDSDEE